MANLIEIKISELPEYLTDILHVRSFDWSVDMSASTLLIFNNLRSYIYAMYTLNKGDVVKLIPTYRNSFTFIYDGYNLDHIYSETNLYNESENMILDGYGYLPSKFCYPDFPLDYWTNHISHNYIRWIKFDSDLGRVFFDETKTKLTPFNINLAVKVNTMEGCINGSHNVYLGLISDETFGDRFPVDEICLLDEGILEMENSVILAQYYTKKFLKKRHFIVNETINTKLPNSLTNIIKQYL